MTAPSFQVSANSPSLNLTLGKYDNLVEDDKFGFVGLIDAADSAVDIWAFATDNASPRLDTKTFPTTAAATYIVSDSASDTAVTVSVQYLDSTGALTTETVTPTGQTPVLIASALDCNRARVNSAAAAVGNIYVMRGNSVTSGVPNTPGDVLAYIPAGYGQTQQALYTVPLAKRCTITRVDLTVSRASGAAGSAIIHLRTRNSGENWVVKRAWNIQTGVTVIDTSGLRLDALANIALRLEDASDADTNATGVFTYLLEDV